MGDGGYIVQWAVAGTQDVILPENIRNIRERRRVEQRPRQVSRKREHPKTRKAKTASQKRRRQTMRKDEADITPVTPSGTDSDQGDTKRISPTGKSRGHLPGSPVPFMPTNLRHHLGNLQTLLKASET